MQRHVSFFGNPIDNCAAKLRIQRQHGAEDFANRGQVVFADPFPQPQQFFGKRRRLIQDFKNSFCGDRRRAVVQLSDDPR